MNYNIHTLHCKHFEIKAAHPFTVAAKMNAPKLTYEKLKTNYTLSIQRISRPHS